MLFKIPNLLTTEELTEMRSRLEKAEFQDGKLTAGWYAQQVKQNQQINAKEARKLSEIIKTALQRHPLVQAAIRPKIIHSILFSRYEVGMAYGRHVDNALMGENGLRSDVSFTVFLNPPEAYNGGELIIEGADDEKAYKLEAGSAIAYPSTTLHRVEPVTQGSRLVAVGWIQSLVRNAAYREILFDLDTARRSIFAQQGKTPEFDLISKSLANLLRQWVD
ncbi:MAG: Fe2+-dependent dioxygenase [Jaaginema sp. PMC 1079.18]|nr:Fe2+-dependent dioxygenase [Jaaginema sp. PMC 1080.18]MEC4850329.1 Fe2+-dependent dioxygenase [Jaaginema sp. PMC 1079.18]MEC4865582.1 Fe2+-dependent dioxygenase [Jaaginema sp. PMC 1078.18]